ncbi:hypothetical protein [Glycomyces algeriensis]|uniref:Uncharacterized protein n=1 Tax=Glycomyces algeriensis TaxID=256037 RepID=A0A9W6G8U4_9ACTN|nr:hypothetical protein [Glycomyces algeriensis]MDA1364666.1 hypothetical protein [Glycomyces algeriensis]MDR7350705.1 hypothetical protein [Glycomyces algeriensis]GLI43415.1 hypothetical protein GALLR39Z86_32650 [Glycomyces algeriensis]
MRRLPSPPRPKPNRSESAVILSFTLAVILLACAVVLFDAAGPAKESVAAILMRGEVFGANYLPDLDYIVGLRFIFSGVLYLVLAIAFGALAVASRIGPRWSVVALGVLCMVGTLVILYLTVAQSLSRSFVYYELREMLQSAAPPWLAPTEGIPPLVTLFGLPLVGILLINRHLRNSATA